MEEQEAVGATVPVAVLVLAYGGPRTLEQVEPFLRRVLAPREPSLEMIERAQERYRAIGGGSPLADNSLAQAGALEAVLNGPSKARVDSIVGERCEVRTFLGMRFAEPGLAEALDQALEFGRGRAVGVILASHQSSRATGGYLADARAARALLSADRPAGWGEVRFVDPWHAHPRFLDAVASRAHVALEACRGDNGGGTLVLFTAHSLPLDDEHDHTAYEEALRETATGVMDRLGDYPWRLGYQSQSPRPGVTWLGPDAAEVLAEEASLGRRRVAVVPLGFVSEHLETLYDLDIGLAGEAARLGVGFSRAGTVQTLPEFIAALADAVVAELEDAGGAWWR